MKKRDAQEQGLKFYCTGKPCKHGHISDRYTKTGHCIECVKIQSTQWKTKNPDKQKAAMRKWWENNKETHNIRVKKWQSANKDKIKVLRTAWDKANPDKVKAKSLRWRAKNPDKVYAAAVESVCRRAKRVPAWLTPEDKKATRATYSLAKELSKVYGFIWEVDHVIPLRGETVSGLHVPQNLQIIPKEINRAKRNKFLA